MSNTATIHSIIVETFPSNPQRSMLRWIQRKGQGVLEDTARRNSAVKMIAVEMSYPAELVDQTFTCLFAGGCSDRGHVFETAVPRKTHPQQWFHIESEGKEKSLY